MPKASARKKAYDTKYHKSPARRAYRACLNKERRKRGIYGKGGPDLDHSKGWNKCSGLKARSKSSNRGDNQRGGNSKKKRMSRKSKKYA
jgi:hypothetical protein